MLMRYEYYISIRLLLHTKIISNSIRNFINQMTIQLLSILLFLNNSTMFVSIIMISLHNCWIIESSRIDMSNNSAIMEILLDT